MSTKKHGVFGQFRGMTHMWRHFQPVLFAMPLYVAVTPEIPRDPKHGLIARLLVGLVGILLFGMVALGIKTNVAFVQFDQSLQFAVSVPRNPLAKMLAGLVTPFGFQVVILTGVCVAAFLTVRGRWSYLGTWLIGIGGGILLNAVLKTAFHRLPPDVTNERFIHGIYSFPSGHAMMAVVVYGLLAHLLLRTLNDPVRRRLVLVAAGGLSFLVGLSRVYLGTHYFSDVFGGFAIGVAWLSVCVVGFEAVCSRNSPPLCPAHRSGDEEPAESNAGERPTFVS